MGIKSSSIRLGLFSLGLVAMQAPVMANNLGEQSGPFFGVRLTVLNPDDSRFMVSNNTAYAYRNNFESPGFGLQFGKEWDNQWQLRSYYDRIRMNVTDSQSSVWGHSYGLDLLHRFDSGIYAGIGANNTRTNRQRNAMARGTLGYQFELLDRFFTSLEYNLQSEGDFTDHLISWSFNYRLGRDADRQTLPREFRERRQRRNSQDGTGQD